MRGGHNSSPRYTATTSIKTNTGNSPKEITTELIKLEAYLVGNVGLRMVRIEQSFDMMPVLKAELVLFISCCIYVLNSEFGEIVAKN